ncbi:oxyreductase [Colletotrichum orchidophilum]|uniref:Oxyreductase n=1 Tax=Colletotrichum orchidophilum TaxID=1209926 RepID=A0A1G4BQJ0_9PEZI|nr:oxyreductase [Colletotrichum orchidophilum]OHF03603.1 oxyreductase [Colletotrichum orchidophilum]
MSRYAEAFENPRGPGDARPTALQIIQDKDLGGKLTGKTILLAGANQGIGLKTFHVLYETRAAVFSDVRSREKSKKSNRQHNRRFQGIRNLRNALKRHIGTNHLAHFFLFQLLKPTLLAAATPDSCSRVVSVSSMAHRASNIRFYDVNFGE